MHEYKPFDILLDCRNLAIGQTLYFLPHVLDRLEQYLILKLHMLEENLKTRRVLQLWCNDRCKYLTFMNERIDDDEVISNFIMKMGGIVEPSIRSIELDVPYDLDTLKDIYHHLNPMEIVMIRVPHGENVVTLKMEYDEHGLTSLMWAIPRDRGGTPLKYFYIYRSPDYDDINEE